MNILHPNAHDINPDTEPGCGFMRGMLNGLADGTAAGMTRWYAERHVGGCPHCVVALAGLRRLRARLKASGAPPTAPFMEQNGVDAELRLLTPDRVAAVEAKWRSLDAREDTP